MDPITSQTKSDPKKIANRESMKKVFAERKINDDELLTNLTLYMRSGPLAKLLFINEIYQEILPIPGCILEFGSYLGATTVLFENLRAVYEPYNHLRRIYSFDTFGGYQLDESSEDIGEEFSEIIKQEIYTTPPGYEKYLAKILEMHEKENVMGHISKHKVVCGKTEETFPRILDTEPQMLVSLAYFDLALYGPTSNALKLLMPRLLPGSIIVFDELGHPSYPGETVAFLEEFQGVSYEIKRSKILSDRSFIRIIRK
jgi:hypothetical protein